MKSKTMALIILVLLTAYPVLGAWQENGTPLYQGANSVSSTAFVSDGSGGGIFLRIEMTSPYSLMVTHLDADGNTAWESPVTNYTVGSNPFLLDAASDGAGGVVFCYYTFTGGLFSLVYNRVLADGTLPLAAGVIVSGTTPCIRPRILCDGAFVYFSWPTTSSNANLYCQKTDLIGTRQWGVNGVALETLSAVSDYPSLVLDGTGGLIIAWDDSRASNRDIYAQRVDNTGNIVWATDGVALCTDPGAQYLADTVSDARGGLIAYWSEYRTGTYGIWGQRISSSGAVAWVLDGTQITPVGESVNSSLVAGLPDGHSLLSWLRTSSGTPSVVVQNIAPDGTLLLGAQGIEAATNLPFDYGYLKDGTVTPAGDGMIVALEGLRYGERDIYALRVDRAGNGIYPANHLPVCTLPLDQNNPLIVVDGTNGCLLVWEDHRSNLQHYYAQHLTGTGFWGNPSATLTSVQDIPDDQGGQINMQWNPSRLDAYPAIDMTYYTLWRSLPAAKIASSAKLITQPGDRENHRGEKVVLVTPGSDKAYYWEFMFLLAPRGLSGYGKTLPTPYDSVSVASSPIDYMVVTETAADSVYFMSQAMGCLSVDNLAPGAVKGLNGTVSYGPSQVDLVWTPNTEADLNHYNLYRGTTPGFAPDQNSLVSAVSDTTFLDISGAGNDYYRLAAVDIHGNQGPDVLLSPAGVSGVGHAPQSVLTIDRIAPNPFNPMTTISFSVRQTGPVRLEIYDLGGHLVRTLINDVLSAGPANAVWRGLDKSGRPVASGAYLARLTDSRGSATQHLTLVK